MPSYPLFCPPPGGPPLHLIGPHTTPRRPAITAPSPERSIDIRNSVLTIIDKQHFIFSLSSPSSSLHLHLQLQLHRRASPFSRLALPRCYLSKSPCVNVVFLSVDLPAPLLVPRAPVLRAEFSHSRPSKAALCIPETHSRHSKHLGHLKNYQDRKSVV